MGPLTEVLATVVDIKRRPRGSIITPSSLVTRDGQPTAQLTPDERTLLVEVIAKAVELQICEVVYAELGSSTWTTIKPDLFPDYFRIALRRR